jgi:taurine--2-oxoglutarate transaminase
MRRKIAQHFDKNVFSAGLTYNSHPMGCAAALATLRVYEEDGLIERAAKMGEVMKRHHDALYQKHPCLGAARNIGLFGILELVSSREPYKPFTAYNGTAPEMQAIARHLRANGLYTFVRWNTIMTNPPLCITEEELAEGFRIIDEALTETDRALPSKS